MNPIVFYQIGGAGCVGEAVRCLRRFVPMDRIWLISDRDYVPGVRRFDVAMFNGAFGEIDRRYVEVQGQPNHPEFEKVCFKRWFSLLHVMFHTTVDRVFAADSDTLICCDPFTSEATCSSPSVPIT